MQKEKQPQHILELENLATAIISALDARSLPRQGIQCHKPRQSSPSAFWKQDAIH